VQKRVGMTAPVCAETRGHDRAYVQARVGMIAPIRVGTIGMIAPMCAYTCEGMITLMCAHTCGRDRAYVYTYVCA
jgi:hypothetical protein